MFSSWISIPIPTLSLCLCLFREILSWLSIHLTETNVSSYASVRMLMHISSAAQRNAKSIPFMQWKDENTMIFLEHTFGIPQFVDFVDYQLGELENLIQSELMFGCSLDSLGISCDFTKMNDSADVLTPGYSALLNPNQPLNPDAERFLAYLSRSEHVKLVSVEGKQLMWDTQIVRVWGDKIALAVQRLAVICHILQGAPGRGTEELIMQASNTKSGRRHLFIIPDQGLLVFFSNYWKGSHVAGRFNEVLRVPPYRVSRLIFAIIRIVRPVELMFLSKARSKAEKETATEAYFASVWSSKGKHPNSTFILDAAQSFFRLPTEDKTLPFAWITGVRMWRHIVVALQRRLFPDFRYTKQVAEAGTQIPDKQAGRTQVTSMQNYAVLKSSVPADNGLLNHYILFSQAWHVFFRQSTTYESDRTYIV